MTVLVIAEHDNHNLKSSTLNTITAATKFNDEIHLIILGNSIENLINNCQSLQEVSKILKCDHEKLENPIPEIMAPITKIRTFIFVTLTPIDSAAISSSRRVIA